LPGDYEAPIYGMLAVNDAIDAVRLEGKRAGQTRSQSSTASPLDEGKPSVLWDGEWEITWVTFRDMGAAFMVALLGIYVLVVASVSQFQTAAGHPDARAADAGGIVLGHMLFQAPFTATSA
jgi:multidrug efflux pump subunit AcrB